MLKKQRKFISCVFVGFIYKGNKNHISVFLGSNRHNCECLGEVCSNAVNVSSAAGHMVVCLCHALSTDQELALFMSVSGLTHVCVPVVMFYS